MMYRQVTAKLRVQRGPGRADLVSARPFREDRQGNRVYTDIESPTLVEFDQYCQVDIPRLLKRGVIVEYSVPKAKRGTK